MNKKLGFGTLRLPSYERMERSFPNIDAAQKLIDRFINQGFSYFDTSPTHLNGEIEEVMRHCLTEHHLRECFLLADRLPLLRIESPEQQELLFFQQLKRCGVSYFDRYLIHSIKAPFYVHAERMGSFQFLSRMKREGYIRQIGFAYHDSPELLEEILARHPEIDFVQLAINYYDWEFGRTRDCYETSRRHQKPIVAMFPLKGGLLADPPQAVKSTLQAASPSLTPAAIALCFVASLPGVERLLCDMRTTNEVIENCRLFSQQIPDDLPLEPLRQAAQQLRALTPVDCIHCEYCLPSCPTDIPINHILWLLNEKKRQPNRKEQDWQRDYVRHTRERGKASDCIECGRCEELCPQQLRIIDLLKEVTFHFESPTPFTTHP